MKMDVKYNLDEGIRIRDGIIREYERRFKNFSENRNPMVYSPGCVAFANLELCVGNKSGAKAIYTEIDSGSGDVFENGLINNGLVPGTLLTGHNSLYTILLAGLSHNKEAEDTYNAIRDNIEIDKTTGLIEYGTSDGGLSYNALNADANGLFGLASYRVGENEEFEKTYQAMEDNFGFNENGLIFLNPGSCTIDLDSQIIFALNAIVKGNHYVVDNIKKQIDKQLINFQSYGNNLLRGRTTDVSVKTVSLYAMLSCPDSFLDMMNGKLN